MRTYIYEATSQETAHLVTDYPWGFQLRTEARFWVESNKRGSRFVQQTKNPKTGEWCKPKKSTYSLVMVAYQEETEEGPRTFYESICMGHDSTETEAFKAKHWDKLDRVRQDNLNHHLDMKKKIEKAFDKAGPIKFEATGKFEEPEQTPKVCAETARNEVESLLKSVLPDSFNIMVTVRTSFLDRSEYLAIGASPSTYEVNGVKGQLPQFVSLRLDLDTWELEPQVFGGMGGNSFHRSTRPDLFPKEKHHALGSVKVPFRKPQKTREAVHRAITRFFERYLELLKEWGDDLRYKEHGDYSFLNVK